MGLLWSQAITRHPRHSERQPARGHLLRRSDLRDTRNQLTYSIDVLDLATRHEIPSSFLTAVNCSTAKTKSSSRCAADNWVRMRAVPRGTTGKEKPTT